VLEIKGEFMSNQREAFEKDFTLPAGITWNDEFKYYESIVGNSEVADFVQIRYAGFCRGWQARQPEIDQLKNQMIDDDHTICVLCKIINKQHHDCTSCPDRDDRLRLIPVKQESK
jgi:hypothetical protein